MGIKLIPEAWIATDTNKSSIAVAMRSKLSQTFLTFSPLLLAGGLDHQIKLNPASDEIGYATTYPQPYLPIN